jgi:type IV pilus assembly protein PilY1
VTRTPKGGYLVTFGTGRYLSLSDPGDTSTQSVYGIWDKGRTTVSRSQLQEQIIEAVTATAGDDTYRLSTHRVGAPTDSPIPNDLVDARSRDAYYASKRGWFIDLPATGERVVADARIRGGRVIFTSIIPTLDPCGYGGSGWILEFDVFTGNRLDSATFDTDNNGSLSDADYLVFGSRGGERNNTSGWRIGAVPAAPAFMGFRDGNANSEIKFVNTSDGTVVQKREAAGTGGEGRVMWRVVQ